MLSQLLPGASMFVWDWSLINIDAMGNVVGSMAILALVVAMSSFKD